jgi:6-pyruvoyltetrahydropterin/6-carboxytetrahydropterin synthase
MAMITRRLEFDSGHRVLGHEGKCKNLHGHRYVAEITVDAPALDQLGRVVDFGMVKGLVGDWIDKYWDHNLLLHPEDPLATVLDSPRLLGREPYIMTRGNPTAENMAAELLQIAQGLFNNAGYRNLLVTCVRLYETPNCWADAYPEYNPENLHNQPAVKPRTMFDTFEGMVKADGV